jgi:hypothetical protein
MENAREVEMDMREMVDKAKKGEPLYGKSTLSPEMQQMAARNSRHSAAFLHMLPWANFVNHNHVSAIELKLEEDTNVALNSMVWTQRNITNRQSEN